MYKICFITTEISNDYNKIDKPKKFIKNPKYDYYLFTNLDKKLFNTSWEVINIEDKYISGLKNNIYKSRYMKFMGWHYIKNIMKKDYDAIIYCDGCYYPKNNINWQNFTKMFINTDSGIIQSIHNQRPYDVYGECDAIVKAKRDNRKNMDLMIEFLKKHNLPKDCRMTENTAFGYNPKNKKLTEALEYFWKLYTTESPTYREQPLWAYVSWKHNINPVIFNNKKYDFNMHKLLFNFIGMGFNRHEYI